MRETIKISDVISFNFNGKAPIVLYSSKELYLGDNLISNDTSASGWYLDENHFFYSEKKSNLQS